MAGTVVAGMVPRRGLSALHRGRDRDLDLSAIAESAPLGSASGTLLSATGADRLGTWPSAGTLCVVDGRSCGVESCGAGLGARRRRCVAHRLGGGSRTHVWSDRVSLASARGDLKKVRANWR